MVQVRLYTFPCYFWSTESTKWRWTHMLRNIRMDHFHAEPLMEPMTLVQDNTSSVFSGTDWKTLASESDINLWHAETNVEKLAEFLVSRGKCKIVTVVVLLLRALVVAVAIRHIKHARLYMLTVCDIYNIYIYIYIFLKQSFYNQSHAHIAISRMASGLSKIRFSLWTLTFNSLQVPVLWPRTTTQETQDSSESLLSLSLSSNSSSVHGDFHVECCASLMRSVFQRSKPTQSTSHAKKVQRKPWNSIKLHCIPWAPQQPMEK